MRDKLKINILKTICNDFIEDFLLENGFLYSNEQKFTVDLGDYGILILPYLVQWIDNRGYFVELLSLELDSMYEIINTIISFIYVSSFELVNKNTQQVATIILSKDFYKILNEFMLFATNNIT